MRANANHDPCWDLCRANEGGPDACQDVFKVQYLGFLLGTTNNNIIMWISSWGKWDLGFVKLWTLRVSILQTGNSIHEHFHQIWPHLCSENIISANNSEKAQNANPTRNQTKILLAPFGAMGITEPMIGDKGVLIRVRGKNERRKTLSVSSAKASPWRRIPTSGQAARWMLDQGRGGCLTRARTKQVINVQKNQKI